MAKKMDERREYRRKRRIRNQILAYLTLIVLLILLIVGGFQGVKRLVGQLHREETQEAQTGAEESVQPPAEGGTISTPDPVEDFTETPTEAPEGSDSDPAMQALLEGMTIEQKVDGLFVVSPEALTNVDRATRAGDGTRSALDEHAVGGILYTSENVTDAAQFKEMISTTKDMYRELYSRPVLTFVREEGAYNTIAGSRTGVEAVSSAAELGGSGNRENAAEAFKTIGTYLAEYGIDVDLAPAAAVKTAENAWLKDRCFSDDADIAASMTGAAIEGMAETGVISCLTSFPGEGGLEADVEKGAGATQKSMDELRDCEFVPFREGIEAGVPMVMVSAMQAPAAGVEVPCMLSETMVSQELREGLGFAGVIITAPLEQIPSSAGIDMGAAAKMALLAGADMITVLKHDDYDAARTAILEAVNSGEISEERLEESLIRIYSMELDRN
ncbi:MAG: hypothetical protein IJ600_11480 [Lachnospiraceae bacterium]|nr:hypothetical protein [Lachnospiraceae bacterium]